MDAHAWVVVFRPRAGWRDSLRRYHVLVDGHRRGTIGRGKAIRIAVTPGRHWIQARIDWTGSPVLEFDAFEYVEVVFRVEPAGNPAQMYQALTETGYLRLTRELDAPFS